MEYEVLHRRGILRILAGTGVGSPLLHRAIAALMDDQELLTIDSLKRAEWITDAPLDADQRTAVLEAVNRNRQQIAALRKLPLDATTPPALSFQTVAGPPTRIDILRNAQPIENVAGPRPKTDEQVAFLPLTELSALVRSRKITSVELTNIYLDRLNRYSPMLRCTVTVTKALALRQAEKADAEISAGIYRGPLHGIPWGAKDLISVPDYPTTWGIPHFKDRVLDQTATVASRLEQAGAVLIAKLSLGALAMGDMWFGGKTRNPWNPKTGSSGSSAGSASATAAGLVGFSLGSETLGSITSPAKQCGVTGFRPTFGRVSRHGCMPLSWSMDKIGPICRSVEDCALVFDAIHGADGQDATATDRPFQWPTNAHISDFKIGYQRSSRNPDRPRPELEILKKLGCELVELGPPPEFENYRTLATIINVEGASVFDTLLRDGHTEGWNEWETIFQSAQFVTAVDYLRLQRLRTQLMNDFEEYIRPVDALVNVFEIFHTNLAGHPSIVLPREFRDLRRGAGQRAIPVTLTGHLNDDERLLLLAHQFQKQLSSHLKRPALDDWLAQFEAGELDPKTDTESSDQKEGAESQPSSKKTPKKQGGK